MGEGFASLVSPDGSHLFEIALSIEMDRFAHRTLELRAFYRQFSDSERPDEYYSYVADPNPARRDELFGMFPEEAAAARREAWLHELSEATAEDVTERARSSLAGAKSWVLVGGPPCQAYSLVGRSRRKHDADFKNDKKHTLYKHYLRLVDDLKPPVFVMENVKGILSSKLGQTSAINLVLQDLAAAGDGYDIYSFVTSRDDEKPLSPSDYVIRCEEFGVPQTRHRVILLGVSKRHPKKPRLLSETRTRVTVAEAIGDLPRCRSHLSNRNGNRDSLAVWETVLAESAAAVAEMCADSDRPVADVAGAAGIFGSYSAPKNDESAAMERLSAWYRRDPRVEQELNHAARSHMRSDLTRYLYCAAFAAVHERSPSLKDFPVGLLPEHDNVKGEIDLAKAAFADRFRVQVASEPAKTVTSHIAKDGHYYIHYDPSQCRSLTVREAARLQTFPDDYFFEGNRTQQYHQVGNAVPPFLARQLAAVVAELMTPGKAARRRPPRRGGR